MTTTKAKKRRHFLHQFKIGFLRGGVVIPLIRVPQEHPLPLNTPPVKNPRKFPWFENHGEELAGGAWSLLEFISEDTVCLKSNKLAPLVF